MATRNQPVAPVAPVDAPQAPPLSDAEIQRMKAQAKALKEDEVIPFPGLPQQRAAWLLTLWQRAERDAADLVRVPFENEPNLTAAEISGLGRYIAYYNQVQAQHQQGLLAKEAMVALKAQEPKLRDERELIFKACDHCFRQKPVEKRQLAELRAGTTLEDLIDDIRKLVVLTAPFEAFFRQLPKNEWDILTRWRGQIVELDRLLGLKGVADADESSTKFRDRVYTLVAQIERRIRAAGDYFYGDDPKAKQYLAFAPPRRVRSGGEEPDAPETPETPET